MTHKLLHKITQKIIYRSAVRPLTKSNPNHRLTEDGGEASTSEQPTSKVPTVFIRSRQDDADPSDIKPMPEFDPDDLILRTLRTIGFSFLSLDMIRCGVTWQRILLHSHGIHICMGLTSILSHGFTRNSKSL